MFILMHCGGMPFDGNTIKERSLGGSETAAYYMAKALTKAGHKVTLFTHCGEREGEYEGVLYVDAGAPTQEYPLGDRFHFYATHTPHDVCIVQRHPLAFNTKYASKINLLWMHDLATYSTKDYVTAQMWNVDGVLCVSEWHKKQVCDVYGLNPDNVFAITNGIDSSIFSGDFCEGTPSIVRTGINLLYSSRPERGLEHLVRPGGIMERLLTTRPDAQLYVCNYNNTTAQMASYYDALYDRIQELPNCTMLGHLTKHQLAGVMRMSDALFYPSEFEETSCITAMEAMAAGLPIIASNTGALPETVNRVRGAATLLPLKDGVADEDAFHDAACKLRKTEHRPTGHDYFNWGAAAARLMVAVNQCFKSAQTTHETMLAHFIHHSDAYVAKAYADTYGLSAETSPALRELERCYSFAFNGNFKEHYEGYYEYEKARGVDYGPEQLDGEQRFETVAAALSELPYGSVVVDYGCAHGHYTINLAKRYPDIHFIGVDITASNVEKARAWAEDDDVPNVRFIWGTMDNGRLTNFDGQPLVPDSVDAVIMAEVLEHVAAPWEWVDDFEQYMKIDGRYVVTTPFGPWEAIGYKQHDPWRAHVWNIERADLHRMFGHHAGFRITCVPNGVDKFGDMMGSYVTTFKTPESFSIPLLTDAHIASKIATTVPRQRISVCMIAKDAADTLSRCLKSVEDIADEIIVAVDNSTTDNTAEIAASFGAKVVSIKSPLETGFSEARNTSISEATGDWVFWVDSDEVVEKAALLRRSARNNQYNGFAMEQHHFTIEPPGVLRTDLPVKLFRNNRGIKFFGFVHEHPEKMLNEGVGHVSMIRNGCVVAHYGYQNEDVRRGRFTRNLALLLEDRKHNPGRHLGKMLWLRDLAQMCGYEAERNGGRVTRDMLDRAETGIALWEELLADNQLRLAVDGLEFYSPLARLFGEGFEADCVFDTAKHGQTGRGQRVSGYFHKREHFDTLLHALISERTKDYDSKYY